MRREALFAPRGDLIDGRFRLPPDPTGEIAVEEPADLERGHEPFPFSSASIDEAVASARAAWPRWRDGSADARAGALHRLRESIDSAREPLAELIAREVGKPLWESRTEVAAMLAKIDITLGEGLELVRERSFELAPGRQGRWRAHARGVLAVLGPFNFPGHLVHGHVVPALALGNCVVIKPSERAPAVGQLYAELCARADLPSGVVNLVQGDGALGAALAGHPDVDGVLFTGSFAVGRSLARATLGQPWKILALEMGGKNGVLICDDADLEAAVHATAYGTAVTAGQRCSATSRAIVHRSLVERFCERLRVALDSLRMGSPLADDVFLGPVVSAAARERHRQVLEWAHEEGAECLLEGGPCDGPRPGHWVRPSLHRVSRTSRESRYQTREHFVPDVFVVPFDSLDEGIQKLEATDYGLVASVFTREREHFERVYRETRLGLLNWNVPTVGASSRLPFGGVKRSGNDRPTGVTATGYCSYPVASLEVAHPEPPRSGPGFPWPD
ncbi:MAG: aldehyde dehydrogenase family protein [Myxococcota bacterium]